MSRYIYLLILSILIQGCSQDSNQPEANTPLP